MESNDVLPGVESDGVEGVEQAPESAAQIIDTVMSAEQTMGVLLMIYLDALDSIDDLFEYRWKQMSKKQIKKEVADALGKSYFLATELKNRQDAAKAKEMNDETIGDN